MVGLGEVRKHKPGKNKVRAQARLCPRPIIFIETRKKVGAVDAFKSHPSSHYYSHTLPLHCLSIPSTWPTGLCLRRGKLIPMKQIFKLLEKKIEETKFVVIPAQTLFGPDFSLLNQDRCPLCTNKLKCGRKSPIWSCRSKKHAKPYVITVKRMNELRVNQQKKAEYLARKFKT